MSTQRQKTAIVIGAGAGGVSTAARLARAGFKVTVLEKNDFSGGRCSLIHHEGWRFDQGPSLLLLPQMFIRTFQDLGTTLQAEGVQLLKCEPNYSIWFGDGEHFKLSTDVATMKAEIEKWEGRDGFERYLAYLQEAHRHYELSVTHVLLRNFDRLTAMMRLSFFRHLLELHPFESIYTRAARYFWSERLRRVFTFGSMYMGMSPFDAPGTYSLLQYTELAEGIWYPVGGFHKVIEALVKVGERLGVQYRFSTPAQSITMSPDGSRATGVRLADGSHLEADVVVNNSDLVYATNKLLKPTHYSKSLSERPASCSSISFYWALDRQVKELETHNIFLADEYKESFDAIFKRHLIPNEPSFYVNVPSRVDSTAAPAGKDSVVVLVPVGHLVDEKNSSTSPNGSANGHNGYSDPIKLLKTSQADGSGLAPSPDQDWPSMLALARRTILATIAQRTGQDLSKYIVHEEINDPATWQQRFNLDKGAILGLSHSFVNVLSFRPTTRARKSGPRDGVAFTLSSYANTLTKNNESSIRDLLSGAITLIARLIEALFPGGYISSLYFVGASTHPGTGVPICLAGAKIVAEQICDDTGMTIPWSPDADKLSQMRDEQDNNPTGSLAAAAKQGREIDRLQKSEGVMALDLQGWIVLLFCLAVGGAGVMIAVWMLGVDGSALGMSALLGTGVTAAFTVGAVYAGIRALG